MVNLEALQQYDVVLTTYGVVTSEVVIPATDPNAPPPKKGPGALQQIYWHRCVHRVKLSLC